MDASLEFLTTIDLTLLLSYICNSLCMLFPVFFAGLLEYYLTPFFCSIPKTLETLNKLPRLNKRMGQSKFLELIVRMTASTPSKTPLYNALTSHFVLDANGGELLMTKDAKSVLKRRSLPSIRNPEEI